jgi:outer membrane biosynthesis protein TonB
MRPILITFMLAFSIHFVPPMVPVQSLLSWLGVMLTEEEDESDIPEQEVLVAVDLDMFHDETPEQDGVDTEADDEVPAQPEEAPEKIVVVPQPSPKSAPPPPPPPAPKVEPKEPPKEPEPQAKKKLRLKGAFEAAGDKNVARAEHPNVNIYLAGSELRKRDLAPMFSELLNAVPAWQTLLGGTGIDPIANFDHVLISAPHMRKKGRWVVARVQYNVTDAKMKAAIGTAAQRSKGKWIADYKLPVASVDNNTRKVVLIENRDQLVVLPNGAEKQIPKLEKVGRFPKNPTAGIFIDIVTPATAFKARGFPFPKSIEKLTLRLSLVGKDGYLVEVEMIDADEASAKKNAKFLAEAIEKKRRIPLPLVKLYIIGEPVFETDGNIIRAKAPVSRAQVKRVLGFVKLWLEDREEAAKAKRAKKKKKAAPKKKRDGVRATTPPKVRKRPSKKKPKSFLDGMRDRMNAE